MSSALPLLDVNALAAAGRNLAIPFRVRIHPEGKPQQELVCKSLLRFLPGKRFVFRAQLGGKTVLAKLFVESRNAARHQQRELDGIEALRRAEILTPSSAGAGELDGGGRYLLFEFLEDAESLGDCWEQTENDEQRVGVLSRALGVIGKMHGAGLFQNDIHLDNFLLVSEALYCIDGADVDFSSQGSPLNIDTSRKNLALFYAQLEPHFDHLIAQSLTYFPEQSSGSGLASDPAELICETARQRQARQDHFLKKIYRECSAFVCESSWRRFVVFDRDYDSPQLRALLQNPDQAMEAGASLKQGNTATVSLIELDGRKLVLKRYNIKSLWHAIQRALQATRASISWRNGHMLDFLGIPTPRPVALLEERFGPFRSRAFLLTECADGEHALDYFLDEASPSDERHRLGCQIVDVLESLYQARISHGDLKATNLLVRSEGPQVIDLDAMKQHHSLTSFRKAFTKDLDRFMKNWKGSRTALDQFAPEVESLRTRLDQL